MTLPEGLRDGYADLGEVRLHYVEAGQGPLVLLLHGFPEFWFGWRGQIGPLAAAGFRVVAPDLRGYNLSGKPDGVRAYATERLARDVRDLIRERGESAAFVAGHDWGGVIAYTLAARHPEVVRRLAILNAPHPRHMARTLLRRPDQLLRSAYALFFQAPWLPERVLRAGDWRILRAGLVRSARDGAFTSKDLARYVEAWSQPGAATAMLRYYRAAVHGLPGAAKPGQVTAPTRVVWGERDPALRPSLAEPSRDDVPGLERVIRLEASHWVQHDEPERVAELLIEFFSAAHEEGAPPHEGRRRRAGFHPARPGRQ